MLKLTIYIPASHLEIVKQALFAAGAGRLGNYDCCCWQVLGQGQFRPLKGSTPYIGTQDNLEVAAEYRVEMLCPDEHRSEIKAAIHRVHPYEEPAFDFTHIVT